MVRKKAASASLQEASDLKKKTLASGPSQSDARITRSMDEVTGIPPLSLPVPSIASPAPPVSGSFVSVVRNTVEDLDLPSSPQDASGNIKISLNEVSEEIDYWKSALICHILGGNPPIAVFQNFVNKTWNAADIDKIVVLARGFYIVRFSNMDARNKAIEAGIPTFDRKPVVIIPWTRGFNPAKFNEQAVPVWVRVPGLPLHYWGKPVLSRIVSQLGKPLRVDNATANKERLHFARILIEMDIGKQFPAEVSFRNEDDELVSFKVEYEWKPIKCRKCGMYGHLDEQCKLEERMQLKCDYCNLKGHTKDQCHRKGKNPMKTGSKEKEEKQPASNASKDKELQAGSDSLSTRGPVIVLRSNEQQPAGSDRGKAAGPECSNPLQSQTDGGESNAGTSLGNNKFQQIADLGEKIVGEGQEPPTNHG